MTCSKARTTAVCLPDKRVESREDAMQLREVDPRTLSLVMRRLRQVPEAAVAAKQESMRSKGQLSPLVAAEHEEQLVLIDGFARQAAAVRLQLPTVTVEVVKLTAVQMKVQLYVRNRDRGLALVEECRLVRDLCEVEGLSQVEVGALLERHKSWVCRRLGIWKGLSPRLVTQGGIEQLESGAVRKLALLPACNQEQLMAVNQREGLAGRDTSMLIDLWRRAPGAEARTYLLEHPRTAIELARSTAKRAADPRLGESAAKVHESLTVMRQAALRVVRQIRAGLEQMPREGTLMLRKACELVERDCPWALREVRRVVGTENDEA